MKPLPELLLWTFMQEFNFQTFPYSNHALLLTIIFSDIFLAKPKYTKILFDWKNKISAKYFYLKFKIKGVKLNLY